MASITRESNGRRTIQFVGSDGKRRSIRLGKLSQRLAEAIKFRVEQLIAAKLSGHAVDADTARWIAELDQGIADKLARVGLVLMRERATLGAFLDAYIARRVDVKPSTQLQYQQVRRNLVDYFGSTKPLRDITAGDADNWRLHLIGKGLADNTVRRRCGRAKHFFTAAARKGLVSSNPFADLKSAVSGNAERLYFVTRDETQRVLDACPDAQWRLLFALSRYGGLRCPSEHLSLRWGDVDWERGRITVPSPKTEHHPGGESRVIPLFPELRPYLDEAFDLAEPETEYVITRYRHRNSNLRTQLQRIIRRAGLEPWPKLFQNLRSTRETELAEKFPLHVVCAWIGNSQPVAVKHYLQVTDEHFARAAKGGAKSGAKAVQNPVQQTAARHRTETQKRRLFRENAGKNDSVRFGAQAPSCPARTRTLNN